MNVLCVEPKFSKQWGKNNQHVGLLKLANYYRSQHHNVEWVIYPRRAQAPPDKVLVTSLFTYLYRPVWQACRYYRRLYPEAEMQLGGIYATLCPEHAQAAGIEVFAGQHPEAMEFAPDIRMLPYKQDFAYLFSSYGCNRACTYCATHLLYGKGIRQIPVSQVIVWIDYIRRTGAKAIWFGDDNLLANPEQHILPLCEAITRRQYKGISFKVPGGMSAMDFTPAVAQAMGRAGFVEISFAIESTSAKVRTKMGRAANVSQETLIKALEYADAAGFERINTNVYFIIGLPYQQLDDMVDTLVFLARLGVWAHPQRFTPIPGTVDYDRLHLDGTDLASLYYGTFVAPGQDNFTDQDLTDIYKLARFFNMGRRLGGEPFGNERIKQLFWNKI